MVEALNTIVNTIIAKNAFSTSREEVRKLIPYLELSFIETPDIDLELCKNKYVKLYNFYVRLFTKSIVPHYLSEKLRTDNLEYSSRIDRHVKYHWVSNQLKTFENFQYYYDETIHIIKKLFEMIQAIDNKLHIDDLRCNSVEEQRVENSVTEFVPEKIVPNTILKIIDSDPIIRKAEQLGEVRLYYGEIHFGSDSILERSESNPFVFRV
jgi:hypothetical protein